MKAYLILCFLLASLLFFPSSLLARELAAEGGKVGTGGTGNRNKPAKPCGKGNPSCRGNPKPAKPCGKGNPSCKGNPKPAKPCGKGNPSCKGNPKPSCGKYNRRGCPPNSGP